jgi:hypothetical protein
LPVKLECIFEFGGPVVLGIHKLGREHSEKSFRKVDSIRRVLPNLKGDD